jgi:hypothetical protein
MEDVPSRAPLFDSDLLVNEEVCPLSGKRPGPACKDHATRHFIRGSAPEATCDWHVHASAREHSGPGEAPFACDPAGSRTIVVLPEEYDGFLASLPANAPGLDPQGLPWFSRSSVPGCGAEAFAQPSLRIDGPAPGSVFVQGDEGEAQTVVLLASLSGSASDRSSFEVEFVVDGDVIGRSRAPFRASYRVAPGDHELVVRPFDRRSPVRGAVSRFSVR